MCVMGWRSGVPTDRVMYLPSLLTTPSQLLVCVVYSRRMHELWGVNSYRKRNKYFTSAWITDLVDNLEDGTDKTEFQATVARLTEEYNNLANKYHSDKAANPNNSLVLG